MEQYTGKRLVYIAGPYTKPDPCMNTYFTIRIATGVWDACKREGIPFVPVVPHLTHFWHTMSPRAYTDWMDLDLSMLERCHVFVKLPGESTGADMEHKHFGARGPRIYPPNALTPEGTIDYIVTRLREMREWSL